MAMNPASTGGMNLGRLTELRQRLLNRIAAVEGAHPTIVPPATYSKFGQLSGSTEFPYFPADLTDPR